MNKDKEQELLLTQSPPASPLIKRKGLIKKGFERKSSQTDLFIGVSDSWDLSPSVRKNSIIFQEKEDEVQKELNKLEKEKPAILPKEKENSFSNLEDIAKVGLLEAAYSGTEYGWKLMKIENEKLWIYRKIIGTSVDAFKAARIVDVSPKKFMAILKNLEKTKEWDQWIDNCKVIDKIDDDTSIFYFSYLTGSPNVQKRDYCVLVALGECENGTQVYSSISVEHKDVPPKENMVRGEIMMRGYIAAPIVENKDKSLVIHVAQYDPKGTGMTEEQKMFIAIQNGLTIEAIEHLAKQLPDNF